MSPSSESEAVELPEPSFQTILWRAGTEAYLATAHLPRKQRAPEYLRIMGEILANEETVSLLFPIRPLSQRGALRVEQRKAVAIFRQLAPTFFARLPRG